MVRQPPTRRAGLVHPTEPSKGPESRRKWVRDSDPAQVVLPRRGGPTDLLTPATAGPLKTSPVGYVVPDWYTDAPRGGSSTDVPRKNTFLARSVPDGHTDEPMRTSPVAPAAPEGHTEVPRKNISPASAVPDGHTDAPRKASSLASALPDWYTDAPRRPSTTDVPGKNTPLVDGPVKSLPVAPAAPDGHTEVPRKASSLASALPDWYTDAPRRPSVLVAQEVTDWHSDVPLKASSIVRAVPRKTSSSASALPNWYTEVQGKTSSLTSAVPNRHSEVPGKPISLAGAVPDGHTDAPRKPSSIARVVPSWYTDVASRTLPTPVTYDVPDWYTDEPRKTSPGAREVPGKPSGAPRKASPVTYGLPDGYTDGPVLTPASDASRTSSNFPDFLMEENDDTEGASEKYTRRLGPFDFDMKSIWQRESDDEKENVGVTKHSRLRPVSKQSDVQTVLADIGLSLSLTTAKARLLGKKTAFPLEPESRRGDAVNFAKLLSHGYREDWFLQREEGDRQAQKNSKNKQK